MNDIRKVLCALGGGGGGQQQEVKLNRYIGNERIIIMLPIDVHRLFFSLYFHYFLFFDECWLKKIERRYVA